MSTNKSIFIALTILATTLSSYAAYRYSSIQELSQQTWLRPEFAMIDIDGQSRNIKDWDGQVILLNFWATWCPPCLEEIPGFIELQEKYADQGFQIIGIAVDDENSVREFASKTNFNYPIIAAEFEAIELAARYGNHSGSLPYSVLINRSKEITDKITGELSKIEAEKLLRNLGFKS